MEASSGLALVSLQRSLFLASSPKLESLSQGPKVQLSEVLVCLFNRGSIFLVSPPKLGSLRQRPQVQLSEGLVCLLYQVANQTKPTERSRQECRGEMNSLDYLQVVYLPTVLSVCERIRTIRRI